MMIPYIVFPGTCKQALAYYASVFEGKISFMTTFADSPVEVQSEHKNRIFNSEFISDKVRFKASDDLPDHPVIVGSNISMFVSFDNKSDRRNVFEELSKEGKVLFPLDDKFGMLRDKYDLQWMLASGEE
ncbi:MAG: VOC family protein [Bacteroidota bacterium]